jgi:hypothetical protein
MSAASDLSRQQKRAKEAQSCGIMGEPDLLMAV